MVILYAFRIFFVIFAVMGKRITTNLMKRITSKTIADTIIDTMVRTVTAVLLLAALPLASVAADIDKLVLSGKRISSADGLSSNTVYDIVQDSCGFVWMGAAYGLCRYDGYSFVNYYSLGRDADHKIDATTGNLYHDEKNALLWVHTSTFVFACYDLKAGRFADYTERGDEARPYRRFLRSGSDMWMYDTRSGIRHVAYGNGTFRCTDYNWENGGLPDSHVTRLVEDGRHGVWVLTASGLLRIGADGTVHKVVSGRRYIIGCEYRGNVLCLSEGNVVEMFSPDGRCLRRMVIPPVLGTVKNVKSNFVWQDRWMVFSGDTYCIDLKTFTASKPSDLQVNNGLLLDTMDGYFFESNSTGGLWIFPPEGKVKKLSLLPGVRFTAERQRKYNIRRGRDGLFYIASYGNGLFIYDYRTEALRHFSANDAQPVIDNDYLTNIYIDHKDNLWVAQDAAGVSRIAVSDQSVAEFVQPEPELKGSWANYVRMTDRGRGGNVVFGTKDNTMYTFDAGSDRVTRTGETVGCPMAYMVDGDGHEWIATRGGGLYVDGRRYSKQDSGQHIPTNDLYDIWEDARGRVWLASHESGLVITRYAADGLMQFTQLLNRSLNEARLHQFEPGPDGWLWIASSNGLYAVDTKLGDITNDDFICFNTSDGGFPSDELRCLRYTGGCLWAGGKGSGVLRCRFGKDMRMEECTVVSTAKGLADNSISALHEDRYGSIWAATENGLSCIYDSDMKVKTYRFGNSFDQNIYSENCALMLADGRLLFGTRHGLTVIMPRRNYESDRRDVPAVCVTDVSVNGVPAAGGALSGRAVSYSDAIRLRHNENSLSLSFSNFEYAGIESSLYQYYLEGVDAEWRPMTSINRADYGNLSPGTYVFHIRSLADGRWSPERRLTIVIGCPWYATWWAWLVYAALASALGLYIYNNARERLRLHQRMRLEEQLTEFRLNFFTSITHEFRTPLAIIQGAVDKLGDGRERPSRAALQTARRGTRRLLRLVNMLMEFRKVSTGNMRLAVENGDIVDFVRDIFQDFRVVAGQKGIQMTLTPFARHYEVPFDHSMVETMVYNLLSNAVKYSPERGSVAVAVRHDGDSIVISVEDNGPGISDDRIGSLFQPFMHGLVSRGGMGIGLYTAHSMAALHHGTLTYRRASAAGGSVFTLSLPATAATYAAADYKRAMAVDTSAGAMQEGRAEEMVRELHPEALNDVVVAVIEDDPDMMEQICGGIGRYFRVRRYTTGQAGLDGIGRERPSLVICDVMLPDTDGYEVVTRLKADDGTARIPVIMLTALDDDRHHVRGYTAGADDYMVKPCNFSLLIARAVQLIRQSRAASVSAVPLAEGSAPSADAVQPAVSPDAASPAMQTDIITSQADKNFIDKVAAIVAQHIDNPDFTIDMLAAQMGMGRTKLFGKMKELTGVSPNRYLQNERMRIAADLLAEGGLSVTEVSYRVGMQDASYFNKCFKARYGVVPSKYVRGGT